MKRVVTLTTAAAAVIAGLAGLELPGVPTADKHQTALATPPRVCVYSQGSIAKLSSFSHLVHGDITCAHVFNDAAPTWAAWVKPWFVDYRNYPDRDWSRWATARGHRRLLVITQGLVPTSELGVDWRAGGAQGRYAGYAATLARNLVAAGLGSSVIRLAPEANLPTRFDWTGSTVVQVSEWRAFWQATVVAMRSVRGARFDFDWCVNAAVRPVPLASFYPGNAYADSVGIDAYDDGVPAGRPRWPTIYGRVDGIRDVARFARARHKPLTIPEWGIGPVSQQQAGGDDPAYVDGIASVVRTWGVTLQSYFFAGPWASQLEHGPRSLAAYRRHFGRGGDSLAGS